MSDDETPTRPSGAARRGGDRRGWTARQPGRWLMHCHISHHLTNDGAQQDGAGRLSTVIDVAA